jgi:hypothetical protein
VYSVSFKCDQVACFSYLEGLDVTSTLSPSNSDNNFDRLIKHWSLLVNLLVYFSFFSCVMFAY